MHRFAILITLVLCLAYTGAADAQQKYRVYIGTYTDKISKGIYRFDFDPSTGALGKVELAVETPKPSFLAIHPNQRHLYAVNETDDFGGNKTGAISAFAIDKKSGNLKFLNSQPSGGAHPCHLVIDKTGKNVLAANYTGGSCCVVPILSDGKLGEPSAVIQHKGSSVNKARQSEPHAHSINLDAANRFAFAADLGLDKVLIYKFDASKGSLTPHGDVDLKPGAGPRHFAFHPNGKTAYVINEMHCTLSAMTYDPDKGTMKVVQTVPTLPGEVQKGYSTAEVVVHPSGRFVYGSNRGHNSIAIFKLNPQPILVGHQGKDIKTPRNFAIDPTGAFLFVANQSGDSVIVFRINQETGELTPTEARAQVPTPVCVRFLPIH